MVVRMTATRGFTNPRVTGPRPDGAVSPGDRFTTDWVHGQELRQLGLATPDDEAAFDAEPAEMMQPHNQISEPDLRRVNARRAAARSPAGGAVPVGPSDAAMPTIAPSAGDAVASPPIDPAPPASPAPAAPTASPLKSNAPAIPPAPGAAG